MSGDNGRHKILRRIKSALVPKYPNTHSTVTLPNLTLSDRILYPEETEITKHTVPPTVTRRTSQYGS